MQPIDQALRALVGRDPTPEEIAKFYKIKEICGFSDHDSVWSLVLAFGHYEILYGEIPARILEQARQLLAAHKDALEATATQAERHVKANLVDSVTKAAQAMADQVIEQSSRITLAKSRKTFLLGASISFGCAALVIGLIGWGAFVAGARSVNGEAGWATSSEGRTARAFAELNDVGALMECGSSFQRREEGKKIFCVPFDARAKKIGGWRIE